MTELVSRAALDAANALAWPGDDDAMVSIADEDGLKAVLEAAAPNIIRSALAEGEQAKRLGIERWFIAPDVVDECLAVWRPRGGYPNVPISVITKREADPGIWRLLAALIPETPEPSDA